MCFPLMSTTTVQRVNNCIYIYKKLLNIVFTHLRTNRPRQLHTCKELTQFKEIRKVDFPEFKYNF